MSSCPRLSLVVTGRNDDYGGGFAERLFRTLTHNLVRLERAGPVEIVFVEWNPVPGAPLLADAVVERFPDARALVVPAAGHEQYSRNPGMPFHEMTAKNVGLRRARGDWIVATNADVLFDDDLAIALASAPLRHHTLYRAQRVDLAGNTPWDRRHDPDQWLPSGEGRWPPPPCFGAAGDFCLAHRDLWHELRGYDERVRFSTRAKDWQFFLSAARRGVPIEFIGRVFHLDHEGGFQGTPAADRTAATAHFGRPWDIEYGLPVTNPVDWGLDACTLEIDPARPSIARVTPSDRWRQDDRANQALSDALAAPADDVDGDTAVMMHALWRAAVEGRRVFADLTSDADLVAFAGLAEVAVEHGVDASMRRPPPAFPGHTPPAIPDWPSQPRGTDLIVRRDGALGVVTAAGTPYEALPRQRPPRAPRFDRVLSRRLLRSWLYLHREGAHTIMLFGAGNHTAAVLQWGLPDAFTYAGILETQPAASTAFGLPVLALDDCPPDAADALVLSSVSYETDMRAAARTRGWRHIVSLYGDTVEVQETAAGLLPATGDMRPEASQLLRSSG